MRLYAVLADIHGNLAALKAVEKDAFELARQVDGKSEPQFVCLGDVVDYGPHPNECVEWVRAHVPADLVIRGNHELDVAADFYVPPVTIDVRFWPITMWTRRVLKRQNRRLIASWGRRLFQPPGLEPFTFSHGSLARDAGYIDHPTTAWESFNHLQTRYGLVGHTHIQSCFIQGVERAHLILGADLDYWNLGHLSFPQIGRFPSRSSDWGMLRVGQWHSLPEAVRMFINPGSVGQPRHPAQLKGQGVPRDLRAAYLMLKLHEDGQGEFQFRRVPYEVNLTVDALKALPWAPLRPDDPAAAPLFNSEDPNSPEVKLRHLLAEMPGALQNLVDTTLIPTLKDFE